jgi:HSP20 family protein
MTHLFYNPRYTPPPLILSVYILLCTLIKHIMSYLYNLNSQPPTFWDFIASFDEAAAQNQPLEHAENQQSSAKPAENSSKGKASGKQATVEDEVTAESASSQEQGKAREPAGQPPNAEPQMPFRGRGRCGGDESARRGHHEGRSGPCNGRRGGRGGFGEPHHQHPPPPGEGVDGFGDFNPFGMRGPPLGGFGLFGPPHCGPPGRSGPPGANPGTHAHHDRQHPPNHPHYHGRGPRGGPNSFNLGEFLSNLGSRLGLDLSGAVEGLGLERLAGGKSSLPEGVDFEPRADIFDTPANYTIHLSLSGAKKEDLGVDWDGENSTLRIGGVVHRPGVDEATLKLLAVDGRKGEVGVFEKKIHLGTRRDPANIDIAGITAKMTDGVLVVKVPKVEVQHKKREVPISGSASPSPVREEKQTAISHRTSSPEPATEKGKEVAAAAAAAATDMDLDRPRSETEKGDEMEYDDPAEQLPEYQAPGPTAAGDSEEEEGEYVKIDVK